MVFIFYSVIMLTFLKMYSCQGEQKTGKYDIKITNIEPCENRNDTQQVGFFRSRMSKVNRTHTSLGGLYALPYGLNDDMQETWDIFSKGSTGGWKRFLTFKNKKACSEKKRLFPEWFQILKMENTSCPIPPGNYTIEDYNLTHWKFSQADVMVYGEYRAKVNHYYKKKHIGCEDYRAELTPLVDTTT